eukprot:gene3806-3721_t
MSPSPHGSLAAAQGLAPSPHPLDASAQPWTVLCVDDEPGILSALKRVLRAEDCQVLQATGGTEALQLMETHIVDVVVSDMRMPGMDGAAFLGHVRARWPDTARILLTGYADMNATIAAINDGQIYRYIHKPWDEAELRLTVRQAAEHRLLQRDRARLQALTAEQNEELRTLNAGLEDRVQERTTELQHANDQLRRNYLTSIKIFSNLMELRSGLLVGHGKRTASQARKVAQTMGLSDSTLQDVFVAGLLHDMGLMALPDSILNKPVGRLSAEEMISYQRHPAPRAPERLLSVAAAQLEPGMALGKDLFSQEGVLLLSAGHVLTAELIGRIKRYAKVEGLALKQDAGTLIPVGL